MRSRTSRRRRLAGAVVAVLTTGLSAVGAGSASASDGQVVWTDSGPVRGTAHPQYRVFEGIPYATPPVGELRWRPPRPPRPWREPRDATKPGDRCAQGQSFTPPSYSEDCLYLNVTTPQEPGLKPVMVWLHGGGNSYGSGGDFDPHRLAVGGDVVVVTINFRLGAFGFFGYPGLAGSGDFGLQDQQAALSWVQRNAVAFGGDPRNVTLFGQSGGAFDVCGQLTSPTARGLFQRVIMQSGSCASSWPANGNGPGVPAGSPWQSLAEARKQGVQLADTLGCSDPATALECMRRLPAKDLVPQGNVLTSVAFGGPVLPEHPERALADGHFTRMPVMSGTTRDEERLQAAFFPPFDSAGSAFTSLLDQAFSTQAGKVAKEYPAGNPPAYRMTWATILTDRAWTCPQLTTDRLLAGQTPTYGYEFAQRDIPTPLPFPADLPAGAYHTSDLVLLLDQTGLNLPLTSAQRELADQMIQYWSRFARTGNPNGPDLPHWTRFNGSTVQSLAAGPAGIHPTNLGREHNCAFWLNLR